MCIRDRTNQILMNAEDTAKKMGDEFVSVEPILLAIVPVSYTHLDVYKRQALLMLRVITIQCMAESEAVGNILIPVSVMSLRFQMCIRDSSSL